MYQTENYKILRLCSKSRYEITALYLIDILYLQVILQSKLKLSGVWTSTGSIWLTFINSIVPVLSAYLLAS